MKVLLLLLLLLLLLVLPLLLPLPPFAVSVSRFGWNLAPMGPSVAPTFSLCRELGGCRRGERNDEPSAQLLGPRLKDFFF